MPKSFSFGTRVTPFQPQKQVKISFGKRKGLLATCIKWNIRNNKWLMRIDEGDDKGKKMHYPEAKLEIISVGKKNYVDKDGKVKMAEGAKIRVGGLDIATEAYEKRKKKAAAAKNGTLGKTGKALLAKALGPKAEDIPDPDGLKDGDSWDAGQQRFTKGDEVKTVTTYTITHADKSFTKSVVTIDYDGSKHVQNTVHEAPAEDAESDVIPDPPGLPDGAGWGAEKEKFSRSDGKNKTVITYTVHLPGSDKTYKIVVTKNYNGKRTVQEIGR